jgi:hypothetical protein
MEFRAAIQTPFVPAKAGTQRNTLQRCGYWIPAYAGMSGEGPAV